MERKIVQASASVLATEGLIPKLKGCQETLDQTDVEKKLLFANYAMNDLLHDPHDIDGAKHVIIRALGAILLIPDDPSKPEPDINYDTYAFYESVFESDFDQLAYVSEWRMLCLGLVNVRVLESRHNPAMEGEFLKSGLYIPAPEVYAAMAA